MASIITLPHETDPDVLDRVTKLLTGQRDEILKTRPDFMTSQIAGPVTELLLAFCKENQRFAEKILADEKKTLKLCFTAALVDVKKDSSDDAVYTRAVQYWYPGCAIKHERKLVLEPEKEKISAPGAISWLDFV